MSRPTGLRCESLTEPLGIDVAQPVLSWRLQDPARGARQTAYRIHVFARAPKTLDAQADVWDSGRVTSSVSADVPYAGPALLPEHRYYWRVEAWDKDDHSYGASALSWFETGLQSAKEWRAHWIGYEDLERQSIRSSHAAWVTVTTNTASLPHDVHGDFRLAFSLDKKVSRAVLYATGEDTIAAWVNGRQVYSPEPLPAWQRTPWGTYSHRDITHEIQQGTNQLAIEVITYLRAGSPSAATRSPMSACLYILFEDGSTKVLSTASPGWKTALEANPGWSDPGLRDNDWQPTAPYKPVGAGDFGNGDTVGVPWPTGPVAALRHSFREEQPVVSARLYATALGAYSFRINGQAIGDQLLAPGWMDFREHVAYQVYDVTKALRPGDNAIVAYLAPGWYSTPLKWLRKGNNYGTTQPALMAQLRLEHADGTVDWIATDASWKGHNSAISQAEIYDGESMDARSQQPGWDTAGFADKDWQAASLVTPEHEPKVLAQYYPPIRAERVLTAKAITQPKPGVYIFDYGQNMSALPRLSVHGTRGDTVQLRFGEVLNADGTLYTENLRTAKATDRYTFAGTRTEEIFEPQFTFHGFRYAELTGVHMAPTKETLQAIVLHTDAPFVTHLSTGDGMVNQLWSSILWGQRSNFVGVPTDCPQRDERLGWSADAQVFWRTAAYNMDLTTFSRKYAADLTGTQSGTAMYGIFAPGVDTANPGFGAAWSDAGVIVPWTGWIQSGNVRIIDENWAGMKAYVGEIEANNPDDLWRNHFGIPFGDWLTPTITTPEDLLATAYWAYDVSLMEQMARATGRSGEADRYASLFEHIKTAFAKAYVTSNGLVGSVDHYPSIPPPTLHPETGTQGENPVIETQTGYVLALYMHLVPDDLRATAADKLVAKIHANHDLLGTGFLGTPYLLAVLAETGHTDLAYKILLSREYPSWGYVIDHGATTTWERWNGDQMRDDPSMNSYNHYAYGAVGEWLYRYAAGVDTLSTDAGFHTIYLHPHFDARLSPLHFDYESPYGVIHSDWTVSGHTATWKVTVPPNSSAVLAPSDTNAVSIAAAAGPSGEHDSGKLLHDPAGRLLLPAGSYTFTAELRP